MDWDYRKLNGKVCEVFGTQGEFAKAMGISEHSISKKLNGLSLWKQNEIIKACKLLRLDNSEIPTYFFNV